MRCLECGAASETVASPGANEGIDLEEVIESPPASVAVEQGVAGRSAAREHERRRKKREDQARQRLGAVGVGIARLTGDPQSTRAWHKGAKGEIHVARRLEKHLAHTPVKLLHDRRVIGHGAANIDHIAVGPGGVTVIDTKRYKGKVAVERVGGLFSPRREILRINGRDQTKLIDGIERQLEYVRVVMRDSGDAEVDARGALCMADVDGLPLLGSLSVRGVIIHGPRKTAALCSRAGTLSPETIERIWRQLATRFPCA